MVIQAVATPPITTILPALIALVATVVGAVIAVGWPTWRSRQRGRRFVGLIRRELEEIGPFLPETDGSADPTPWWAYLSKRFVHEEFLSRERLASQRDFVLDLDPTVLYLVSQLWISFEKRDRKQWIHYLSALADNTLVGSERLKKAVEDWKRIQPERQTDTWVRSSVGQRRSSVEHVSGLFEARLEAYRELTGILMPPATADRQRRLALSDPNEGALAAWYRKSGLLLSGDALDRYLRLRDLLRRKSGESGDLEKAIDDAKSALRTELKIDLGVRHPDERDEPTDGARRRG
jgi:hypothetical protein